MGIMEVYSVVFVVNGYVNEMFKLFYVSRRSYLSMLSLVGDVCWFLMLFLVFLGVVRCILR